jgi:hypothetical protein
VIRPARGASAWAAAALVATAALARADEPTVRAEVDATRIGVADQVQLTVTIEGRAVDVTEEPALPLENLRLVGGPAVSQQISFVNGAVSQARSYTYVLQPVAVGRAEIGAVQVKLGGGVVKAAAPIRIEVVAGSVGTRPARPRSPFDDPSGGEDPFGSVFGRRRPRAEPKLQVVATASRTKVHVGEPVLVTYFVYTQASVSDVQLAEAPQYPGLWAEDLEDAKTGPRGERATLNGESYVRFPILRKLLFPTRAGQLTIPPARFRIGLARLSFFDAGPGRVERSTEPLTLTAEAVPSEPGWSGAVGEFDVQAALDRDSVALGEAATLRFTVKGTGNLKWVDRAPEVLLPGAKVYPPQTRSDLKVGPAGMAGSKTWEFVVVPETSGALTVPPLPFAYFAPSAGAVKRAQTAALTLKVAGGPVAAVGQAAASGAVAPPRAVGLALRSDLDQAVRRLPVLGPRAVLTTLGALVLLHGAIAATTHLADRRRRALGRPALRRDVRGALGDLERARRGGLGKEEAAALIERTLHGVFGPVAENGGPPDGEREKAIRDVLQQVQFIRYAPQLGDYSEAIRDVAARAADVVRKWA